MNLLGLWWTDPLQLWYWTWTFWLGRGLYCPPVVPAELRLFSEVGWPYQIGRRARAKLSRTEASPKGWISPYLTQDQDCKYSVIFELFYCSFDCIHILVFTKARVFSILWVLLYKQTAEHTTHIFGNCWTFMHSWATWHHCAAWLTSRKLKHCLWLKCHRTWTHNITRTQERMQTASIQHWWEHKQAPEGEDESPADAGNNTVKSQGQQNKGKGRKKMVNREEWDQMVCQAHCSHHTYILTYPPCLFF